jgi:ferrochelatase
MPQNHSAKIGVIVAQLGTPEAPDAKSLRPYLGQFLSDMRVIDYHPFVWQPILRGIILRVRPRKSAKLYERVWTDEGSPLLIYTQRQAEGLQERLGDEYQVVVGMTYGEPSMKNAMQTLEEQGISRVVVLPMYPQYSSTTSASVYDAAYTAAAGRRCPFFNDRKRNIPTLRFVTPYYDHPDYIEVMAKHLKERIAQAGKQPDLILLSFHGIPERYVRTGDPYREQCEITAQLLAERLQLEPNQWRMSFQSQFGPEEWLQPYTEDVLTSAHKEGYESIMIFAPGFLADCLETIDELGNEGLEQWEEGGGHAEGFYLAPCLNDNADWIDVMADIVQQEAMGWTRASQSRRQAMPVTNDANVTS